MIKRESLGFRPLESRMCPVCLQKSILQNSVRKIDAGNCLMVACCWKTACSFQQQNAFKKFADFSDQRVLKFIPGNCWKYTV